MLTIENISSGYGKLQILDDISVSAEPGKVTVIVGPNGSGKSTLLKTVAGLATIYSGSVTLDGDRLSGLRPHEIARRGLAYLPQTESSFTQLRVSENFRMAGYTVGKSDYPTRLKEALLMFPQIEGYIDKKVSQLSGGERQMVAMIMALIRQPKVIMFDEPTANLAPKVATLVLETIHSLAKDLGLTVILVEQNARRALEMGDRAYLLISGRKVFEGGGKELLEHKELGRLYLGLKAA